MYFLRCGTTAFKQQSFNTAETMLSLWNKDAYRLFQQSVTLHF
jgi:hypothetical protein